VTPEFFQAYRFFVSRWEGGYSNRPLEQDPGGPTNWGITQATSDSWHSKKGLTRIPVSQLRRNTAELIFWEEYWMRGRCDRMPWPLSAVHFDSMVQHGRGPALLQEALNLRGAGLRVDGVIGPATLAVAAPPERAEQHAELLLARRLLYYPTLTNYESNARGWTRRMLDLHRLALGAEPGGP
jgi:lysozyme family protein